ncbi:hypothetical protein I6G56_28350 [Burkholderia humptydooensis]|uniref:Uncharacterized protein n=1 Tax=Burkholderia humptydooensis TaxID=430531 RepID=A0A7T2X0F1_9BURK|nr:MULTISPECIES: hypothetical protein [Burkholderia]QPS46030.1 hypothetical protein I6G56_28350 [Burkholderia humptydooensis]
MSLSPCHSRVSAGPDHFSQRRAIRLINRLCFYRSDWMSGSAGEMEGGGFYWRGDFKKAQPFHVSRWRAIIKENGDDSSMENA